jgi:hypothetical protein
LIAPWGGSSGTIESAKDLSNFDHDRAIKNRAPELLLVQVETELEDYESVVTRMEARGKSIFDVTSSKSSLSRKVVSFPSRGFICNDRVEYSNMREGPSAKNYKVVAQLPNNMSVSVLEETSNSETGRPWLRISAMEKEGFVDKDLVSTEECAQSVVASVQPDKAVICNSKVS